MAATRYCRRRSHGTGAMTRRFETAPPPEAANLLASVGAAARTAQSIGIEWIDYARQSVAASSAAAEALSAAGTLAEAAAIQADYASGNWERLLDRAETLGGLYGTLASDMAAPFATPFAAALAQAPPSKAA